MTYGLVVDSTPSQDPTFRGEVVLCALAEDKVAGFEGMTRDVELPSSPLRVPVGFVRRDCQDWVWGVVRLAVERGVIPGDVETKLEGVPTLVLLDDE